MKYFLHFIVIASLSLSQTLANNVENLTTIYEQFSINSGVDLPLFQISEELYFPPCTQNMISGVILCYPQLYDCQIYQDWVLNNEEQFACVTRNEISIFDLSSNFSLINSTSIGTPKLQIRDIESFNGYLCFSLYNSSDSNIEIYDSLSNSFVWNFTIQGPYFIEWPIETGLFYSRSQSILEFIQYETGNNTVVANFTDVNNMTIVAIQTYQNNTLILVQFYESDQNYQFLIINISNTTQQGAPIYATDIVKINDTNFVLWNEETLLMCTINQSNLEINVLYSINISSYYGQTAPYMVNYMLDVSEIQVYYRVEAYLYFSFDSNSFKFLRAVPYIASQFDRPAFFPTTFNLSLDVIIMFCPTGYWTFNSYGVDFVNLPIQNIQWLDYNVDSLWVLSPTVANGPFQLLNFNSETGNITTFTYFDYPCTMNAYPNPTIIAMDNSANQPIFVLSCNNIQAENYVLTPLNTYGPYKSYWSALLNVENTTITFLEYNGFGLKLVSYNYTANITTPSSNVTLIPENIYAVGSKITENLILTMSKNNSEYSFLVFNVTSNHVIQNFSGFLEVTPQVMYPHSINLTSNFPVQSLIVGYYCLFYEFSVNSSQFQEIFSSYEWSYYDSFGSNSALFYQSIGQSSAWNFEIIEYIGPLPDPPSPLPPTPTPSSGSIMNIYVLASIALLIII